MDLTITEETANWYKEELHIEPPAYIRFFPRYGFGGHIPGFSIGINVDTPEDIYVETEVGEITFYIEKKDAWYFDGTNLHVTYDEKLKEPKFSYDQ